MPRGNTFGARKNFDGVSMRFLEDYEIRTDLSIARLDILYGKLCPRPRAAVRTHADG
jgi:hypothetical protein